MIVDTLAKCVVNKFFILSHDLHLNFRLFNVDFYKASSADRTHYSVIMVKKTSLAKHYPTSRKVAYQTILSLFSVEFLCTGHTVRNELTTQ